MKKYCLWLAYLYCICFFSCKEFHKESSMLAKTAESKILELDIDLDKNKLPLDSLMDFVSYVKLETTGDNLVGAISQILFVKDKIIVVDSDVSKTITVYSESGKYLNKIGKLGQGPGEYAYLGL